MSDCVFCKIVKGEAPTKIVYQDEDFIVFYDIAPKAPVHVLIVPKKHLASLQEAKKEEDQALLGKMLLLAKKIAQDLGVAGSGYQLIINTGRDVGQIVFHLHLHLLSWKNREGGANL